MNNAFNVKAAPFFKDIKSVELHNNGILEEGKKHSYLIGTNLYTVTRIKGKVVAEKDGFMPLQPGQVPEDRKKSNGRSAAEGYNTLNLTKFQMLRTSVKEFFTHRVAQGTIYSRADQLAALYNKK